MNSPYKNVGAVSNKGFDFRLSTVNVKNNRFNWRTDITVSHNVNKILALNSDGAALYGYYGTTIAAKSVVGRSIGEFWGYVFDGIYMTEEEYNRQPKHVSSAVGTTRMKDINGDGVITADDRTYIGNPNPRMIFGMANDLRYKNFDFSVVVAGQTGNQIMNTNMQNIVNIDGIFNVTKDMANRWRSLENPGNGKVPRTLSNTTGTIPPWQQQLGVRRGLPDHQEHHTGIYFRPEAPEIPAIGPPLRKRATGIRIHEISRPEP